ncbi:MEDS domain-containing protein [Dichotomicrobium thermohalophilum]|uniref:histidine kinase n=1 Tax=Dichotomicrobium thermohalophilum TaxID=933063 RepID=A0A397PIH5_9HYPH|nr:MEDS domain-containing protein [Dichotomicrobium thermohalophilum]RIA47689.1 PAS domain S-box-containing protein [Dichotomicrobium thermohalophilum]
MNSQGKCAAATANAPLRNSGLEPIGDLPWGTHFCKFYTNRAELVETLVRYFKAGLEANEFCLWVTSEPLRADEATNALRKAVPGLDQFIADGQIEILDNSHWRTLHGDCDADRVLDVFCSKLDAARQRGFEGLRLSGDRSWLACNDRDELTRYEARMNSVIGSLRVLALCTCALEECTPREALDLVGTHEFALIRDGAKCRVLGNLARLKAERELKESREDLARAQAVAQTGSWRLDVNHNALTWSAETFRIFGLPRGTPLTYETFLSAVHPDDREYVDRNWQAALQGAPYDIEHRILVDGQTKWVRERAELEFDEQGRLLGGFGTVQDITPRNKARRRCGKVKRGRASLCRASHKPSGKPTRTEP